MESYNSDEETLFLYINGLGISDRENNNAIETCSLSDTVKDCLDYNSSKDDDYRESVEYTSVQNLYENIPEQSLSEIESSQSNEVENSEKVDKLNEETENSRLEITKDQTEDASVEKNSFPKKKRGRKSKDRIYTGEELKELVTPYIYSKLLPIEKDILKSEKKSKGSKEDSSKTKGRKRFDVIHGRLMRVIFNLPKFLRDKYFADKYRKNSKKYFSEFCPKVVDGLMRISKILIKSFCFPESITSDCVCYSFCIYLASFWCSTKELGQRIKSADGICKYCIQEKNTCKSKLGSNATIAKVKKISHRNPLVLILFRLVLAVAKTNSKLKGCSKELKSLISQLSNV